MFEKQIGIDLGTVNILVYVKGRGVVLREPSVVAIDVSTNRIVAIGSDAQQMLGRNPESIEVAQPLKAGVIADYIVTEAMLRYFIRKIVGRFPLIRPQVMVSIPKGVTTVEARAVHDAAMQAGARVAYLLPEPLAAAYGAGLPIETPTGNMVVDMGGGTSEAAIVSLDDIVVWSSVRVGGTRLNEAIISYVRKKYNLMIGEQTADELKIAIGSALLPEDSTTMEVRGRDQIGGLPKTIQITSEEITEAMSEPLGLIINVIKQTLEQAPPELASDIIDRGMVLTGGGALLRHVSDLITKETGVPAFVAEEPMACVAIGAGRALENYDMMRRGIMSV